MNLKKIGIFIFCLSLAALAGNGPVSYYGELNVSGNEITGANTGSAVQLHGVSLGWSNTGWESADFFNATTVTHMVDDWKAEIIRAPLGYNGGSGGYNMDSASNVARVESVISAAIAKDVYVIIDWHSHSLDSTVTEKEKATAFFSTMAQKYGSYHNVVFEIFNEPITASWSTIRPVEMALVDTIRKYSDNLILAGTPYYSQDVDDVVSDPITGTNIMTGKARSNIAYTFHFYAGTHTLGGVGNNSLTYQNKIITTLNAGYAIFVSEYGTTHADGGSATAGHYYTHDATSADAWLSFLDDYGISSCAWNVNDKYEGSSFFGISSTPSFDGSVAANWYNTSLMTTSGEYIYNKLNSYASSAVWRSVSSSSATSSSSITELSSSSSVAESLSSSSSVELSSSSSVTELSSSSSSVESSSSNGGDITFLAENGDRQWNMKATREGLALSVGNAGMVSLDIFDVTGKRVKQLRIYSTGNFLISKSDLPSGLYLARARFGSAQEIRYFLLK